MSAKRGTQVVAGVLAGAGAGVFCASCLGLAGGVLGIGIGGFVGGVGGAILGAAILVGALALGQVRTRRRPSGPIACCADETESAARPAAPDERLRTP
jgi:hypothetical protein